MKAVMDAIKAEILQRVFELLFVHRDIERVNAYLAEKLEQITPYSVYCVLVARADPATLAIYPHEPVGPAFIDELVASVTAASERLGGKLDAGRLQVRVLPESRVQRHRRGVPRSYVNIPIFEEGGLVGVICIASTRAGLYKNTDLSFLSHIAEMLAKTYSTIRSDVEAREHELARLREAERKKDKFLSAVSHELRSPLTILSGLLEMLRTGQPGQLNEQQHEFVSSALEQATRLKWFMENLLDLSKIEAGTLDLSRQSASVSDLLNTAVRALRFQLERKGLILEIDAGVEGLPTVCVDPNRVIQVLVNLVDNAAKYTAAGGAVHLSAHTRQPLEECIEFSVSDNGRGIPPEDQLHVFDRFYRLGRQVRGAASTGLGLSIAKEIVENQGGRIWVESEEGRGSTFYFTSPIYEADRSLKGYLRDVQRRASDLESPLTFLVMMISGHIYGEAEEIVNAVLRSSESVFQYAAGKGALVLGLFTELADAERTAQRLQARIEEEANPDQAHASVRWTCLLARSAQHGPSAADNDVADAALARVSRVVRKMAREGPGSGKGRNDHGFQAQGS